MKFGKIFKKQMVPEWVEAYVDYNGLKRILKQIRSHTQHSKLLTRVASTASHQAEALHRSFSGLSFHHRNSGGGGDIEDQVIKVDQQDDSDSRRNKLYKTKFLKKSDEFEECFFKKLDENLNKVNRFYREKVEEVLEEAGLLDKQMDALIALRVKVKKPDDASHLNLEKHPSDKVVVDDDTSSMRTPGSVNRDMVHGIDRTSIPEEEASHIVTDIVPVSHTDGEDGSGDKQDLHEILERVKMNDALESPMSTLKGFFGDSRNDEPISKKGLKKAEEQLRLVFSEFYQKLRRLKEYSFMNLLAFSKIMKKYEKIASRNASRNYMKTVDNSLIGSSDEVNRLLERVEVTFVKHFSSGNRREGMKCLRPKVKRERHRVTFFSGFFSGCSIALIVAVVFKIESRKLMEKDYGTAYMANIIPLYSLFGYIILHMLMYSANIYFWRLYRVNYTFIFGFKQGTELGYREVFLVSTGLSVLAFICFLLNLQFDMDWKMKVHNTLPEVIPLGLVTIVLFILLCPFNIIYRSSRVFFLRSLLHCICAPLYEVTLPDFFLADHLTSQVQAIRSLELFICYYGLGEYMQRQEKCHSHGVYNVFYFVVGVIPYWLRFLQCIRRLCEENESVHGYNALKYMLTIIAVIIRTAFELRKGRNWMILALVSSGVAICMNTFWDIVIDWGLLRRHSKNPYLRDKLLVPHKSVYFAAMVVDVILRVAWMQLVLEFNLKSLHKVAVSTIISCLEIVRRGMWSFFRLENEHLNNVGKYRAFKSVPHPFHYYDNDETDDKDD
ncbi:Phosphate transporter PHO1-like protein 10 [Raphanus sativus]|uniref:Phosphate transporter PHO1 homolog 10 isoform X1 n=1 Tax=Raphanus sativus TaxID=3726 RepID=A0A6J0LS97_RAPSA|nr:phosphate transporter PHO1 homolog 10 isoform X1 [Raphanus sativus]XP_056851326.1 phosphate transporter PHO1 homolog 10 isoform X1 [Raphanus sativus]KAJ4874653.1 Phosphate transporter PHO1-like protein 10 [Raphanus sativus]